jgi:energy-coupling factor transporter ATP-binding protein EcfA2
VPRAHVVVESQTPISTRGRQVCGMFDAPPEDKQRLECDIALPIEERPWQIGLIYGPSGSGKSTVARSLFGGETKVDWRPRTGLIDNFPAGMGVEQIAAICGAVGLNTIPCWLRPHEVLSNGEKFRADMARLLAEAPDGSTVLVDEFTSVVDRQVAQVASHALQKAVRKRPGLRFVAVSCHHDIIDWLQPDWTLDMGSGGKFDWGSLRRRPELQCTIARVDRSAWSRFARYHYLTAELANAAQCFGRWAATADGGPPGSRPRNSAQGCRSGCQRVGFPSQPQADQPLAEKWRWERDSNPRCP